MIEPVTAQLDASRTQAMFVQSHGEFPCQDLQAVVNILCRADRLGKDLADAMRWRRESRLERFGKIAQGLIQPFKQGAAEAADNGCARQGIKVADLPQAETTQ